MARAPPGDRGDGHLPSRTVFVRNSTAAAVALDGDEITGDVQVLETLPE
jgi:hypothetical protein